MIVVPDPVPKKRTPSWACHAQQCLGFTNNGVTNKKHPVSGSTVGEKSLLMRGRRRMERIAVQANWKATNRQITAQYNSGVQNGISVRTTRRSLLRMGYRNNKRLQWAHNHQHWTFEEWKNIAWNMTARSVYLSGLCSPLTSPQ